MIITNKSVYRHIINKLKSKYKLKLIGSIKNKGYSNKDIDLLLCLPQYPESDKIFKQFETDLKALNWQYDFTDIYMKTGIFHNYFKRNISLDVFIDEI